MIRAHSHVSTILKLTLVTVCAAMVILWPTWRMALQEQGYYQEGRMTGGGSCDAPGVQVTHGFQLHCDPSEGSNNLEVNWRVEGETGSHQFHLDNLVTASCFEDPNFSEGQPVAGFNTYIGAGTGSFDGASGATALWTFTDKGEPGKDNDTFAITIISAGGTTVLNVNLNPACTLSGGNHQAHREQ